MNLYTKLLLLSVCVLLQMQACNKSNSEKATVPPDNTIIARDKYTWPFASTSIWNMPIGSDAIYLPANLPVAGHLGIDEEWHIKVNAGDPMREILQPARWDKRWPG